MMAKRSRDPTTHFCSKIRFFLGFIAILEIFSGLIVIGGRGGKSGGEWEPHLAHLVWLLLKSHCSSSGNRSVYSACPRILFTGEDRHAGPWKNAPRFLQVTPVETQHQYQLLKNVTGYTKLWEHTEVHRNPNTWQQQLLLGSFLSCFHSWQCPLIWLAWWWHNFCPSIDGDETGEIIRLLCFTCSCQLVSNEPTVLSVESCLTFFPRSEWS